jgi:hypothetical protein
MKPLSCLLFAFFLPFSAIAEVVCALGPGASSYNSYSDQRPTNDAMQLAARVNAALKPICSPRCPILALFRNSTAPNAMLEAGTEQAKIVYAPQFFTSVYDTWGDGAIIVVIAHELGHALDETVPAKWTNGIPAPELRADAWAGCVLARSDLSVNDLSGALTAASKYPSPSHPGWNLRLPALRLGYSQCGGNVSNFDAAARTKSK